MLERIIISVTCFISATLAFILIFNFFEIEFRATMLETVFAVFFFISVIAMFILPNNFIFKEINYSKALNIITFANAAILYILLFLTFSHLYFVIDRSISVRTMIELDKKPKIGMTKEELFQHYNGDMVMDRRLDHLIYGKYVKLDDKKYIDTSKGKVFAKVFNFLKKFLNLGYGG